MKNLLLIFSLTTLFLCANAQDTTKMFNNEIGVNAVGLVKQLISNNPAQTLGQLPYTVFYNLYYKNLVGLRVGFGGNHAKSSTKIDGQPLPRESSQTELNYRLGVSYNFLSQQRITCNAFADVVGGSRKLSSANTNTSQSFPGPVFTSTTIKTETSTSAIGGQIGLGLKYKVYKNLSVYTEMPAVFVKQSDKSLIETTIQNTTATTTKSESSGSGNSFQIIVPVTVYFVLTF